MPTDHIRYDLLVQDALKGVVRSVLAEAARDGLKGEHHFCLTFRTQAPGVKLSARVREQHPEEMTIILQHQFWDLVVTEQAFEVGLSFGHVPERLTIPFDAVTGFWDPSVQFGLKFEVQDEAPKSGANDASPAPKTPARPLAPKPAEPEPAPSDAKGRSPKTAPKLAGKDEATQPVAGDKVVSIDAFRKKP